MRRFWSKAKRALGRRRNLADELQQEMDAHLQWLIDENLERGMSPAEAAAKARRQFGNETTVRERSCRLPPGMTKRYESTRWCGSLIFRPGHSFGRGG